MREQPFDQIAPALLPAVERVVVDEHAALERDALGREWSPAMAYRWIRYESPDPVGRLIAALERLEAGWAAAPEQRAAWRELEVERWRTIFETAREHGYAAAPAR